MFAFFLFLTAGVHNEGMILAMSHYPLLLAASGNL